jgi:phosphoribosylanthranilate isomerase
MKVQLKANALSHLTDARYFASMEVDWMGFNLDPLAENASSPQFVKAIREWISGPAFIGEFNYASASEILSITENAGLDTIQLGPLFNYTELNMIPDSYTIFAECMMDENFPDASLQAFLQQYSAKVNYYILNFSNLFEPLSIQWKNSLVSLCKAYPIFIHSNGNAPQILDHIQYFNPLGYCLSGGSEEKTGMKSFDELDEIFDQLSTLALK